MIILVLIFVYSTFDNSVVYSITLLMIFYQCIPLLIFWSEKGAPFIVFSVTVGQENPGKQLIFLPESFKWR